MPDAHAGGRPDPEAVIAVLAGIDSVRWPDGNGKVQLSGMHRQEIAEAALVAAGRVLAKRLRVEQGKHVSPGPHCCIGAAAFLVSSWCGVPEGDEGGEQR